MTVSTRIAVIAVGDRFRHDDGVGCAVLSRLRERAADRPLPPGTVLSECELDPGRLIGLWHGAELAVVLEAARACPSRPGRIYRLELGSTELRQPGTMSPNGLGEAVEIARELGRLPGHLVAYAVDSADTSLGAGLSDPVAATVDHLARRVEDEIVRHRVAAARGAA
jgi:hydrogenase maturation protease